jgi:hypothetical protein
MTTNQATPTEPGARAGVIKLGLDVHASSIVVVRQSDAQGSQPAQHFSPEQFLGFARKQVARAEAVHSCLRGRTVRLRAAPAAGGAGGA